MGLVADIRKDLEQGALRLVAEYRDRLYAEAVRLCGDPVEAEDLVSMTFDRVGKQCGVYPTVIDGITGVSKEERPHATKTLIATCLAHDIRPTLQHSADAGLITKTFRRLVDWGVGEDDCEYFAYHDPANPVKCSAADVYVVTYRRGAKLLVAACSWTPESRKVTLTYPGGTRELTVPGHEFELLEL